MRTSLLFTRIRKMPNKKFAPHGDYIPVVDGSVLIAHCWGSWNIEMHRKSSELAKPLVEKLIANGPWGVVTVIHESMVTSLEVLQAGRDAVAELPEPYRPVALAWVMNPRIEGYGFLHTRYENMYAGLLETRTFDNVPHAQFWIEKLIASKPKGHVA